MDTHKGVQEGTKTPNTDGSPAGSKNQKQLEMEGHSTFIQECAVEDEEWKWSPVYLLLRDFSDLAGHLPRPWKHTAEEWSQIQKFIRCEFSLFQHHFEPSSIVVALKLTWKLHFSESITDVDLNALSQRLEHVSQEKEFGSNLSRVGKLMSKRHNMTWDDALDMHLWHILRVDMCEPSVWTSQEQQILANDIAFFKAPLETPGHQEVMKRICNHLVGIAGHAMLVNDCHEFLKDMWIGGHPKNEQEMLIQEWKEIVFYSYQYHYYYWISLR
ncbi:hypothetical protein CY35_01G032700 [Sphagnum magellanicum]|nr:hypothetical protein CY35_01G032700 [Sphagnum magellanicum]